MMLQSNFLAGEQVYLTALTENDMELIAAWHQDVDLLRLLDARVATPRTPAELRDHVSQVHESSSSMIFGVRLRDGDRLVGMVEFDGILWNHGVSGISLVIGDRDDWGHGYGTEALHLALRYAFAELNLRRVQLTVFSYNRRAISLYERTGLKREGTFREFLQRDGETYDMYLYGLLRREWSVTPS